MRKIQVENTIYEVDDDFRTAIRCNQIAEDETIGDFERALGVLMTLFGEKAIDNTNHYEKLLKWAKKYLSCGNENISIEQEPTMDYIEDEKYIKSSFKYDYGYNTNRLLYLYSEMNDKNMEILIKYKPKEDNKEKVRIFGEYFVNNNKKNCKIIYNNKEYPLKEYLNNIDK